MKARIIIAALLAAATLACGERDGDAPLVESVIDETLAAGGEPQGAKDGTVIATTAVGLAALATGFAIRWSARHL